MYTIQAGIYQIINEVNGKSYIGSSKDVPSRWRKWKYNLKKGTKCNKHMIHAVNKYGLENFTFILLEECQPNQDTLQNREQHYIDTIKPEYNVQQKAYLNKQEILKQIAASNMKVHNHDAFVKKARKVHSTKYDYSQFEFINTTTKSTILCHDHGPFEQTPRSHMYGHGCMQCGFLKTGNSLRSPLSDFFEKAKTVHDDRYDYSQFEYINNKTKSKIICNKHGTFEQSPEVHVSLKGDCPLCANVKKGRSKRQNAGMAFEYKARTIHGDKYDYSLFEYVSVHDKGTIICNKHGSFLQKPVKHLSGQGCPKCRYS